MQQAIVDGDVDYVVDYYTRVNGLRVSSPPTPRCSLTPKKEREGDENDGNADFLIDDAILLATVYKQKAIVDRLMQIKYEKAEDIISQASISFIRRHPRISWNVPRAIRVISRATVAEKEDVIDILSRLSVTDHVAAIIQATGVCIPHIIHSYISVYRHDRRAIDYLIREMIDAHDKRAGIAIAAAIHVMSVSMLRMCARVIPARDMANGTRQPPEELLRDVISCRDFGKGYRAYLALMGKVKGWDIKYMQVILGRDV